MRRLVVALVVAVLALTLVGCGGGGKEPAPPVDNTNVTAPPITAPAPVASEETTIPGEGYSTNEGPVFMLFPTESGVPTDVAELIEAKQPTLIFFYDGSQHSSKETRKIINAVLKKNRGLVELVAYDIGKYVSNDAAKPVEVGKGFDKDSKYQAAVDLARLLEVSYTPFIVLTDSQGYIVWKFRGLGDRDVIEREVLRASD